MKKPVLTVSQVGKAYRAYGSEWRRVLTWFGLPFSPRTEHWTLQNISFTLEAGEALGIVGQNGAGKSTLLKIITGTLHPTTGSVVRQGRISAILELGMGFHPDLTGRQNAYHSAGLMGYTEQEIDAVIAEIEAFAEIGDYFNQPIRVYSSGMQVRVAFAIATAFRPEILIIDEALSVGDAYFQHKSFEKIREFREQGTSLLFVSHDKAAVLALCDRALLLEKGKIIKDAGPEAVMDFYNALLADKEGHRIEQIVQEDGKVQTISGTGEATIENIGLYNGQGEQVEIVSVGERVELRLTIKIHTDIPSLVLGYSIKDRLGQVMYGTNTWHTNQPIESPRQHEVYLFALAFAVNLGVGSYSVQTALVDKDTHLTANYEWKDMAIMFNVVNTNKTTFVGCLWNEPLISIEKKE